MRRAFLIWPALLAFLAVVVFIPVWRIESSTMAATTIAGDADGVFQSAINLDEWPSWRGDVSAIRHLEEDGFRAEIVTSGGTAIYAFDLDFQSRVMTWQSRDERWRLAVGETNGGAQVQISRSRTTRTLARWLWDLVTGASSAPYAMLDDLTLRCQGDACAGDGDAP